MSISGSGERITYKCSYCGSAIASFYDPYRFTDICPNCHGSVLIPRRDAPPPTMPTDATFPTSGEFPQVSFGQESAARAPSGVSQQPSIPESEAQMPAITVPAGHDLPPAAITVKEGAPLPPVAPPLVVPAAAETPVEKTQHTPHLSIFKHPEDRTAVEALVHHTNAPSPSPSSRADDTTQFKPLTEAPTFSEPPAVVPPPPVPAPKTAFDPTSSSVLLDKSLQDLSPMPPNQLRDVAQASEPVPSEHASTIYKPIDPMHDELVRAYGSLSVNGAPPPLSPLAPPSPAPKESSLLASPPAASPTPPPTAFGGFAAPFTTQTPVLPGPGSGEMPRPESTNETLAPTVLMKALSDPASSSPQAPLPGATDRIDVRPTAKQDPILSRPDTGVVNYSATENAAAQTPPSFSDVPATPQHGPRWGLLAASLLIVVAAGAYVTQTVLSGMRTDERAKVVEAQIREMRQRITDGDLDAADTAAGHAQALLSSVKAENESTWTPIKLDESRVRSWNAQIKNTHELKSDKAGIDEIFKDASKEPEKVRNALEPKLTLYQKEGREGNAALQKLVNDKLAELNRMAVETKEAQLNKDLQAAEELYKQGKIELSGKAAAELLENLPRKPAVVAPELEKQAQKLVDRAARLKEIAALVARTPADKIGDARKKVQDEIQRYAPTDETYAPLLKRLKTIDTDLATNEAAHAEILRQELVAKRRKEHPLDLQQQAYLAQMLFGLQSYDADFESGKADGDAIKFKYAGKDFRLGNLGLVQDPKLFIDAGVNRILLDPRHFWDNKKNDTNFGQRPYRVFRHAIALGNAMQAAGVSSTDPWDAKEEAPFVSARRVDKDGKEYLFLGDRLYIGKAQEKTDLQKQMDEKFRKSAEALAVAVEKDEPTPLEVRDMLAVAIRASYTNADWYDHLPSDFVRKVVNEGYCEANMPGADVRLKKELAAFRESYKEISNPFLNFSGTHDADELGEYRTFDDKAVWRIYDKRSDQTTFCVKNPDDERDCLFVLYDYPGKLADLSAFPDINTAKLVRMTHQAVGVTAKYAPATGKFNYDPIKWDLAAELEMPKLSKEYREEKGYGEPGWSLPPHVLLVDKMANTVGLVTKYGRVDVTDFSKVPEAKRKEAMDTFMTQLNTALPHSPSEGSYLHLYYRYFFEYILDSPVTNHPNLLGSRTHCGDIHQTTYQSLMRLMGGRYCGDCDDLAEFFMDLTRKTNHLSYVMSLPMHAACGWAEKAPSGTGWEFYILDTGPPRKFTNPSLDKVIENASRAYDQEGTMRFDPKSLGFLFRFNGEPTRTPYYLSTRMFNDPEYAVLMERVQSYWHFHFYALGIQTMLDRIEKQGDKVSENYNEVAGLYGQVREVEKSIKMSMESIKNMKEDEHLSRMSEEERIATMWRTEHDNEKCYAALKPIVSELNSLRSKPQESLNYIGMRLTIMSMLTSVERPWEGWALIRPDIEFLESVGNQRGVQFLKLEHAATMTGTYLKMKDLVANRKVLTPAELKQMQSLEKILERFFGNGKAFFEEEDDFTQYMQKYAVLSSFYAGKFGRKKYLEEMLKDGPYPAPGDKRDHSDRRKPLPEDWNWIRLSIASYSTGIGDAIDFDDPPEKWRIPEAVKLCDQMLKAGKQAEKFGSLGNLEFALLSTRVLRAFLVKDWKDLEAVVKVTAERDWAKLTSDIAENFGHGARFVTPEEFAEQYRMFTKYITSKPSYFTVLYEAYRADGFKQTIAAIPIALEHNPKDEDMKREAVYLKELAEKKLKERAEKEKAKEKTAAAAKPEDAKKEPAK